MLSIVPFSQQYTTAFKELNVWWITQYFSMEEEDYKALDHPKENIIDQGGHILIALWDQEPVGVCALIPSFMDCYDFELVKMGVSPEAHGKGIGYALGMAIADTARSAGAKSIFLESNTVLEPAINLYKKLGFKEVEAFPSPYARCNIQMELQL